MGGLEHIGGESFLGGSIRRIFADAMSSEPIPDAKALGFSAMAYVAILVGIALALLKAFVWSKGVFTSEVFGYALAGALIPGGIAYAIAARKKVRNPNRFALWFLLLCIFFLLLELSHR